MPLQRRRAVLFDLDGTLVDSIASVDRCWARLVDAIGLPIDPGFRHGVPSVENVRPLLPDASREVIDHWVDVHLELEVEDAGSIAAYPGAHDLLTWLDDVDVPWAIATSGARPLAEARFAAASLPRPRAFATREDYVRPKPYADPFVHAAALLGLPAGATIVVEDAPAGVAAGRAAGAYVIAVTTTHDRPALAEADLVVDSLTELLETLRARNLLEGGPAE